MGQQYDERRGGGNGPIHCFECKKTIQELIEESARRERERILEIVEIYFKGLILIPRPQDTKQSLIDKIKSLE